MSFYLYTLSMNGYGLATTVAEFDTQTAAEAAKSAIKQKFTPNDEIPLFFVRSLYLAQTRHNPCTSHR